MLSTLRLHYVVIRYVMLRYVTMRCVALLCFTFRYTSLLASLCFISFLHVVTSSPPSRARTIKSCCLFELVRAQSLRWTKAQITQAQKEPIVCLQWLNALSIWMSRQLVLHSDVTWTLQVVTHRRCYITVLFAIFSLLYYIIFASFFPAASYTTRNFFTFDSQIAIFFYHIFSLLLYTRNTNKIIYLKNSIT